MYAPGTIITTSDKKYIVDENGCWRVYQYEEGSTVWKMLKRINSSLTESVES